MLSGIGPASQLQAHGIPVVSDLQGVGNNMIVGILSKDDIDLPYISFRIKHSSSLSINST